MLFEDKPGQMCVGRAQVLVIVQFLCSANQSPFWLHRAGVVVQPLAHAWMELHLEVILISSSTCLQQLSPSHVTLASCPDQQNSRAEKAARMYIVRSGSRRLWVKVWGLRSMAR